MKGYLRTASSESKCPTTPSSTDPGVQVKLFLNILDKHTHNGPYLKNKAINLANLTTQLRKQRQKPTARTRAEPGTRNRELGTGNQEQGTRNQETGTKNQESGIRNRKPGTGNQELGTRNQVWAQAWKRMGWGLLDASAAFPAAAVGKALILVPSSS